MEERGVGGLEHPASTRMTGSTQHPLGEVQSHPLAGLEPRLAPASPSLPSCPAGLPHSLFCSFLCNPEGLEKPPSPHLCARRCPLWGGGERVPLQLPASCPDSWLPPETGQCREMFAPKQLCCLRNCLTLPRKANAGSSTLLPPQSGDQRPKLAGWPSRGVSSAEGVIGNPDAGRRGAQGHLSLGTGAFLPAGIRKRALSLSVGYLRARWSIFIWRAAALDSSGPKIMKIAL